MSYLLASVVLFTAVALLVDAPQPPIDAPFCVNEGR